MTQEGKTLLWFLSSVVIGVFVGYCAVKLFDALFLLSDTGYDLICAGSTALGAGVFMRLVTVQNRRKDTNDRLIAVTFAILSVPLLILGVVL
jgi:hypothetical protein